MSISTPCRQKILQELLNDLSRWVHERSLNRVDVDRGAPEGRLQPTVSKAPVLRPERGKTHERCELR